MSTLFEPEEKQTTQDTLLSIQASQSIVRMPFCNRNNSQRACPGTVQVNRQSEEYCTSLGKACLQVSTGYEINSGSNTVNVHLGTNVSVQMALPDRLNSQQINCISSLYDNHRSYLLQQRHILQQNVQPISPMQNMLQLPSTDIVQPSQAMANMSNMLQLPSPDIVQPSQAMANMSNILQLPSPDIVQPTPPLSSPSFSALSSTSSSDLQIISSLTSAHTLQAIHHMPPTQVMPRLEPIQAMPPTQALEPIQAIEAIEPIQAVEAIQLDSQSGNEIENEIDYVFDNNESAQVISSDESEDRKQDECEDSYVFFGNTTWTIVFCQRTQTFLHTLPCGTVYRIHPVKGPAYDPRLSYRVAVIEKHKWIRPHPSSGSHTLYLLPYWQCGSISREQYTQWKSKPDSIFDIFRHSILVDSQYGLVIEWEQLWEVASNFADDPMKKDYFRKNGQEKFYVDEQMNSARIQIDILRKTFDAFKIQSHKVYLISVDSSWVAQFELYIANVEGLTLVENVADAESMVVQSEAVLDFTAENNLDLLLGLVLGIPAVHELYVQILYQEDYGLFNPSPEYVLTHIATIEAGIFGSYQVLVDSFGSSDKISRLLSTGGATVYNWHTITDTQASDSGLIVIVAAHTRLSEARSLKEKYQTKIKEPCLVKENWIWDSLAVVSVESANIKIMRTSDISDYILPTD